MNSIIFKVCAIVLSVRAVNANHCDIDEICKQPKKMKSPFTSEYILYPAINDLNVIFNFENLSPDVFFTIFYEEDVQKKKETKILLENGDGKDCFPFKSKLKSDVKNISLYLTLKTTHGCSKNITILKGRIFDARRYTEAAHKEFEYMNECLRPCPCIIEVDLRNECSAENSQTNETTTITSDTTDVSQTEATIPITSNANTENNKSEKPSANSITESTKIVFGIESATISADKQTTSPTNKLIFIIPSVLLITVFLFVVYIIVKKYRYRNSQSDEAMELDTYATASELIYEELNLGHENSQLTRNHEESAYANIIGVLKPVNENVDSK